MDALQILIVDSNFDLQRLSVPPLPSLRRLAVRENRVLRRLEISSADVARVLESFGHNDSPSLVSTCPPNDVNICLVRQYCDPLVYRCGR